MRFGLPFKFAKGLVQALCSDLGGSTSGHKGSENYPGGVCGRGVYDVAVSLA